jgi:aldose 1-epimerase
MYWYSGREKLKKHFLSRVILSVYKLLENKLNFRSLKMKIAIILFLLFVLSYVPANAGQNQKEDKAIVKSLFGKMEDGRDVYEYTLKNKKGAEIKVINYGAAIVSLTAPNRNGKYEDIVFGYDNLDGYIKGTYFFGAVVGRYANRIAKGKITLEGKTYQLSVNDGENELHGGKVGFDKVFWDAKTFQGKQGPSIELTYVSPDGDMGYPGKVTLHVTYTLTNNNELKVYYEGTTDKTTILNPSQHSYFNLSGNPNTTILAEQIKINADAFTPVDKGLIPTGKIEKVAGTPLDFRKLTTIGARINDKYEQLELGKGYDFNWVLNNYTGKVREAADVYDPESGRYMQVFTDQPGLQFYSGNFLNGKQAGKGGVAYQFRSALALEAQHYPDSPNEPKWPSVVLKPGQVYKQTTIYKFSTK